MPGYLIDKQIWVALWPIFALPLLVTLFLIWFSTKKLIHRSQLSKLFIIVFAFSLLGVVTGQITGMSRAPAVGAVLPAILSLVGGVLVYLIGVKGQRTQAFLAIATIGMVSCLLIGTFWGAKSRDLYEFAVQSPERLLARELELEKIRHKVSLQKLLNYSQITELHEKLEREKGRDIPLPIESK